MACKVVRWKSPVVLFLSATNPFVENFNKWTAKSEKNYMFSSNRCPERNFSSDL